MSQLGHLGKVIVFSDQSSSLGLMGEKSFGLFIIVLGSMLSEESGPVVESPWETTTNAIIFFFAAEIWWIPE